MSDALSGLEQQYRDVIKDALVEHDPALLASLSGQQIPTTDQRRRVLDILSDEFSRHVKPDSEPAERGVQIDDALGQFLLLWPIERDA